MKIIVLKKVAFLPVLVALLLPCASYAEDESSGNVGSGIRKGGQAAERGAKKGANSAGKGIKKGVDATGKGLQKGGEWVGSGAKKVGKKLDKIFK